MNKKILIVFAAFLIFLLFFVWFRQKKDQQHLSTSPSSKVQVIATFYPLAEFTRQIGGEFVDVTTLVPAGVEPHDFEPSTQDIARLHSSKMFVYNGAGFEGWITKILPDLEQNQVKVVDSSQGISLLPNDPHIWLDPVLAEQQVKNIEKSLIEIDPTHTEQYQQRTNQYLEKLHQLDQEFVTGLANCQQHEIVTSHAAFGYLAEQYHLGVIAIAGLSPDAEPSPQRLAEIVQQVKKQHIQYIFFETLVSPTLANTIATETGAKTVVFNPLEGLSDADMMKGKEYISVQQENLQNLRLALSCQ